MCVCWRNIRTVVKIGKEEVEYDYTNADLSITKPSTTKDVVAQTKCTNAFRAKEEVDIFDTKKFKMHYFQEYEDPKTDVIECDIVSDT